MQPRPIAETSRLLLPSFRFFIFRVTRWRNLVHTGAAVARGFARVVAVLLENRVSKGWSQFVPQVGQSIQRPRQGVFRISPEQFSGICFKKPR